MASPQIKSTKVLKPKAIGLTQHIKLQNKNHHPPPFHPTEQHSLYAVDAQSPRAAPVCKQVVPVWSRKLRASGSHGRRRRSESGCWEVSSLGRLGRSPREERKAVTFKQALRGRKKLIITTWPHLMESIQLYPKLHLQ